MTINAKDAMPNGGSVTYRVSKQTLEVPKAGLVTIPAGDYFQIELEDTGTGMPEQVIHHAFEPFYTTKGAAGTGLGLSMVYGFITESGGHISIQSSSTGTTITLLVPRVKAEHT